MDARNQITTVTKARYLLKDGERAIVLPTRGDHLDIFPDGTGTSGHWKVSRKRRLPERVIIYLHTGKGASRKNEVLIADHAGLIGPDAQGKHIIRLMNVHRVGLTESNWREFAETRRISFVYVEGSDETT